MMDSNSVPHYYVFILNLSVPAWTNELAALSIHWSKVKTKPILKGHTITIYFPVWQNEFNMRFVEMIKEKVKGMKIDNL